MMENGSNYEASYSHLSYNRPMTTHHPLYSACIILFLWYKPPHKALLIEYAYSSVPGRLQKLIYYPPHFQQQLKCPGDTNIPNKWWLMKESHDFINWYQIDGFSWIFIDNQHSFLWTPGQCVSACSWYHLKACSLCSVPYLPLFLCFYERNGNP